MIFSLFVLFLVSLSVATGPYELIFERTDSSNDITVLCRDPTTLQEVIATLRRKTFLQSDGVEVATVNSSYELELTPHKEGYYYCTSPDNPSITSDIKLLLYYPVKAVETADFYVVPAGSTVTLFCGIELGPTSQKLANKNSSPIKYTWTRGKTTIDAALVDLEPVATTISQTKLKDGDIYSCDVEVDTFPVRHEVALLVYNMTVIVHSDKAESELKIVEIPEGEQNNATFYCHFEAFVGRNTFRSVNISWTYKDEQISALDSKYVTTIVKENDNCMLKDKKCHLRLNSTLTIYNITRDDNGLVVCYVQIQATGPQNGVEKVIIVTDSATLRVVSEPQPTIKPSEEENNAQQQVSLTLLAVLVTVVVVALVFLGTVALIAGCVVVFRVTRCNCDDKERKGTTTAYSPREELTTTV